MKVLIIMAHGSRREESNQEVVQLAKSLSSLLKKQYDLVQACFLEVATPSLETLISQLQTNLNDFLIFNIYPYFLNTGKHIKIDIVEQVLKMRTKYLHSHFDLLEHFGSAPTILDCLVQDITTCRIRSLS